MFLILMSWMGAGFPLHLFDSNNEDATWVECMSGGPCLIHPGQVHVRGSLPSAHLHQVHVGGGLPSAHLRAGLTDYIFYLPAGRWAAQCEAGLGQSIFSPF